MNLHIAHLIKQLFLLALDSIFMQGKQIAHQYGYTTGLKFEISAYPYVAQGGAIELSPCKPRLGLGF